MTIKELRKEFHETVKRAERMTGENSNVVNFYKTEWETLENLYATGAVSRRTDYISDEMLALAAGYDPQKKDCGFTVVRCLDLAYIYATKKHVRNMMMLFLGISEQSEQEQSEQEQSEQEQSEQKQSEQEQSEQEQSEQEQSEQEQSEQEQSEENAPKQKIVYKIDILKALKEAGYSQGRIKREKLLNGSAVDKIRTGNTDISLKTLGAICNLLNAKPGDIITIK